MANKLDHDILKRAARILKVDQDSISLSQKVTSQQAAKITGIHVKSIQRYAKDGKLKGVSYFGVAIQIPLRALVGLKPVKPGRPSADEKKSRRTTTATAFA